MVSRACGNPVDMQHDFVLKKLYCDLLTPVPGSGGGWGSTGKIIASMLSHHFRYIHCS